MFFGLFKTQREKSQEAEQKEKQERMRLEQIKIEEEQNKIELEQQRLKEKEAEEDRIKMKALEEAQAQKAQEEIAKLKHIGSNKKNEILQEVSFNHSDDPASEEGLLRRLEIDLEIIKPEVTKLDLVNTELRILEDKYQILEDEDEDYCWQYLNRNLPEEKLSNIKKQQSKLEEANQIVAMVGRQVKRLSPNIVKLISERIKKEYAKYFDIPLDFSAKEFQAPLTWFVVCREIGTFNYLVKKEYLPVLTRKAKQLIYRDEYGDVHYEKFLNELLHFAHTRDLEEINEEICEIFPERITRVLFDWNSYVANISYLVYPVPQREDFESDKDIQKAKELVSDMLFEVLKNVLEKKVLRVLESTANPKTMETEPETKEPEISPYDYEEKIGRKFKILGWNSIVTKGSGDQGADVIIEKGEHRGVVQCKMYSQPVGNKAVQEVHAAKSYYDATFSVVVSNQDYTPSARMLATKLGVYLINDSEIRNFSELF